MSRFLAKRKHFLILTLGILLIIFPLSFFLNVPKWDNIDCFLPYRYFISDYAWNGHWPWWNPFQNLGYPGYSDLQSGAWYPIVWISLLLGKYTITSLMIELVFHFLLAGWGMFYLSRLFFNDSRIGLLLGLSYGLSGFMVGSTQLMIFLIPTAWLPWILYFLFSWFKNFKNKYLILSALSISMHITGSSPAYTIVLIYILLGIFIYQFLKQSQRKIFVLRSTWLLLLVAGLILPYITSFLDFAPYFNRLSPLQSDRLLGLNPWTLPSYISFILPYGVLADSSLFSITDLSCRNSYLGLLSIGVAIFFLLKMKFQKKHWILISLLVLSMVLAAGKETLFYDWILHLPGFGRFKHPSMYRTYIILLLLLLAGFGYQEVLKKEQNYQVRNVLIGIGLLILGIVIFSWQTTNGSNLIEAFGDLFSSKERPKQTLASLLIVNGVFSFMVICIGFVLMSSKRITVFTVLVVITLLDLGIHARMTSKTTMVYSGVSYGESQNFFNELPNEMNQSVAHENFKKLDGKSGLKHCCGIWRNVSTFHKTLSYQGHNPTAFSRYDKATNSDFSLQSHLEHPLFYSPNKELVLNHPKIGYNKFEIFVKNPSEKSQVLILNQNYHHLWEVRAKEVKLQPLVHQDLTIRVDVPSSFIGKISFEYDSKKTKFAFILSLALYIGLAFIVIRNRFL
ncbi:MAG: hypothetical protein N4A45_11610 [Flavobacteriales bacterium]|jgi:hypothetical protein|nr:hypothetical protein [Flavobacteriales bacterium]